MPKIIIIGAGIAGMTAAMYLQEAGYDVEIYECSNHIGGRCFSFSNAATSHTIDNGTHLFSGAYIEFFRLMNWLNNSHLFENNENLSVDFVDVKVDIKDAYSEYRLDCRCPNNQLGLIFGLLRMRDIGIVDKFLSARLLGLIFRGIKGDDYSVSKLFEKLGLSDIAIKRLWKPLVVSIMNAPIEQASAKLFLSTMRKILRTSLSLQNSAVPIMDLFEGFDKKVEVHYNSLVSKIIVSNGKCTGVVVNGNETPADYVISTLLPKQLSRLHPFFETFLNIFPSSPILSVYIWTDTNLIEQKRLCCIGTNIEWIFRHNDLHTNTSYYSVTISAAKDILKLSNVELIKLIKSELSEITHITDFEIKSYRIIKSYNATPLITFENNAKRPQTKCEIKNLLLAGDWILTHLPATIESAALSGKLAAEFIS